MKKLISIALIICSAVASLYSQRYIPLIEVGRTLEEPLQGPNNHVHDLIEYNGKLLLVGEFDQINDQPIESIAYWDGEAFSAFDVPLEENYYIRDVLDTPLGLVVSGNFDELGNILLFDGGSWVELGNGFDDNVLDIIWYDDQLIACGKFELSGNNQTLGIASWDGTSWNQLGDGLDDRVKEMIVFNNELYAVGEFDYSGPTELNHIGKWNGTEWLPVDNGFNQDANSMEIFEGKLIIGGAFDGDASSIEPYGQVVILEDGEFSTLVDLGESVYEIGHLSVIHDQLFMTAGSNTLSSFSNNEEGWVLKDETVKDLTMSYGVEEFVEIGNKIYTACLDSDDVSNEADLYQSSAIGRLILNSSLETSLENEFVQTKVYHSATGFLDIEDSHSGHLVTPFENEVGAVYAAAPWMTYLTPDNQIKGAYQTFGNHHDDPYRIRMGPLSDEFDTDYAIKYFRVWDITAEEIAMHIDNYMDVNYTMPEVIKNWPGNGRVNFGESSHLAPFVDVNENGWYEPYLGDYPDIKGDHAVYSLFSGSRSDNIFGIYCDIGVMYYIHDTQNADLGNTIYVKYDISNRSNSDFNNFQFGYWADLDVGNSSDDYVGSAPDLDLYFGYNGDSVDEASSSSPGFGSNIPAQGIKLLTHPMNSFMYYHNSNGITGDPELLIHYYNYMNHTWQDGSPLTYGEIGTNPNNPPTNFMFPSCPAEEPDQSTWTELSTSNNPGDRRGIAATDGFLIAAGEKICIEVACITAFSDEDEFNNLSSVVKLKDRAGLVQEHFNESLSSCGAEQFPLSLGEHQYSSNSLLAYPNPTTHTLQLQGLYSGLSQIEIFTIHGKLVLQKEVRSSSAEFFLNHLEAGIYILRETNEEGNSRQIKLVKE